MLQQTMAALRRWFNRDAAPEDVVAVDVDRRLNMRLLTNVVTTARPADVANGPAVPVRVRDISRGGINLLLADTIDSGSLLSIDFPAVEGMPPYTMLATVLHVSQLPNGEWAAGCAFACELGDGDVRSFVTQRRDTVEPDQRKAARFPCVTRAFFRDVNEDDAPPEQARVMDVSPNGIGMLVTRPLTVGTLLSLELPGVRDDSMVTILASVARSGPANGGGEWVAGCTFSRELTDREMRTLV